MPANLPTLSNASLAVIGLGYVGLPLSVEFGKSLPTVGFDINTRRINELREGNDHTREVTGDELAAAAYLNFADDLQDLADCNVYIVTVPTPVDHCNRPDLSPLFGACRSVGSVLKRGDVVVFESTVYPGATEEDCAPILESVSGLKVNEDFFLGYSPERMNPGDKERSVTKIIKVTSGSTDEAACFVDQLYASIVTAGTHLASSIRVAEAAKVIENTQRDLNIALINELAIIFNRLGIDTQEVLLAAGTKWNFLNFRPGLVGGHCIGVDPYYLTHKAQAAGYHPEVILSGRRINDGMSGYVVSQLVKEMIKQGIDVGSGRALVMGVTFKENCGDIRNSKVIDVITELLDYGMTVDYCDPWIEKDLPIRSDRLHHQPAPDADQYEAVLLAVGHKQFCEQPSTYFRTLCKCPGILYDLKYLLPKSDSDLRL